MICTVQNSSISKNTLAVQRQVIPALLESSLTGFGIGRAGYRPSDVCVSAPTGSGKTLAFVIPIVQVALLENSVCRIEETGLFLKVCFKYKLVI